MIFSGQYDDNGLPIMMENAGGRYYEGISSDAKDLDFEDDYYKITRYTGNMQNLNNELANYQNMIDSGNYIKTPTAVSSLSSLGLKDLTPANPSIPVETLLQQPVPSYKAGGLLNFKDNYFSSANRYNRLEDRANKYNIDLLQSDGTAKTNQELASETRSARNAAFANSGVGKAAGVVSSIAPQVRGMILAGGTPGDYEPERAKAAGAVSGLGTGLQLGMNFGPIGAALGAVLGGVGGALFGKSQAKKAEEERKENKENLLAANIASGKTQNEVRSAGVLGQYDTEGITSSYYAKYGGFMGQPDYTVEGGELMMAPNNNPPQTDNNGRVTQVGKNMFKFEGDTHDAPSGGIGVQGGNSEFASQTNQVLDSGFVFSDRLKADPNDYLKNI